MASAQFLIRLIDRFQQPHALAAKLILSHRPRGDAVEGSPDDVHRANGEPWGDGGAFDDPLRDHAR
jgi:hypothetical protein